MDLYIDVKKLSVGGWCIWIITSALVLFLSFEIEIGNGPGPELDNKVTRHLSTENDLIYLLMTSYLLQVAK